MNATTRASAPIDDFDLPWASFAEFFASQHHSRTTYLVELDHDAGTRREWTYEQWQRWIDGAADTLADLGVQQGECVAGLSGSSADALKLAFACWVRGACYLPLNPHEPVERLSYVLNDAQARFVVHTDAWAADANRIIAGTVARTVSSASLDRGSPAEHDKHPGASLDTPALRVYTSGTTGAPKGVVLTTANLLTDCDALHRALDWKLGTRLLTILPIHHVNGLVVSSLQSWYGGHTTVLCDRFRSDRFWQDVTAEGIEACSMVPSLLEFLLADDTGPAPDHFREVLCGAGPLMSDTVANFEERFDVPVRHLYGLSETTAVATLMDRSPEPSRHTWYSDHGFPSIGPAVPHVEVAVHDPDGNTCPPDRRGELVIRGATVMSCYAGRTDETAEALRDGWFHTGDEGFWLPAPDGTPYFFITGRLKELIIRGGVNISPLSIDQVLTSHPAVRFGLAIPFENRYYGEEVAAYVVCDEEASEQEIIEYCAQWLDFAYQPKVVVFGDDVPFTATGKAKRLDLKQQLSDALDTYRDTQFRRNGKDPSR
ncbi:acyl--CoA ligase [Prauserella halophila]|uniref:Acyl--CoA ligase n=1 Tax=Prauserella halophila TaxID=185641 RepID=A0ABN1WIY3_9PSEU|nr:class I adenylate-forming enzyme family protein [Prauserella halophila]MCP2238237.1 Acyl-CoA synthetase (AMP-forming)/AMP-acid ligase II [Prauserella halophila]